MSGVLQGRDWTVWEQIDDVLGLALNRATTAYLNALDDGSGTAGDWQAVAHDLATLKQVTGAKVASGEEVPPNISQTDLYDRIEAALEPFTMSGEMQDAIGGLPFVAANPDHAMASRNVLSDLGLPRAAGIPLAVGAGLLAMWAAWHWIQKPGRR